jgi:hypothetical protein
MNFHLQFPVQLFKEKINYRDKMLFIGSCFTERIGNKMKEHKFSLNLNPHGILYNPASIASALRRYISGGNLNESELFYANETWNSWEHHSCFSGPDKLKCLENMNTSISEAREQLQNTKWLFITFGSAFTYSLKEEKRLVGNCHKVPQTKFDKRLLKAQEIVKEFETLFSELKQFNPDLNIVLTVSPVKYVRDGVVENVLSKSVLIAAVHELVKRNNNAFYFPAYELVTEDLRDYRFYEADLVHPNEQAISYVFEKFMNASFSNETKEIFEKIKEIRTAASHRSFNEGSDSNKRFASVYLKRCEELSFEFPFLDLSEESVHFRALT